MSKFWKWYDKIVDWMAAFAGVILIFTTLAVCYGIATRFFFNSPSIWVAQATEYALLWMVFLGTTWLLREKGHVCVDIIYASLSEKAKTRLDLVMDGLAAIACAVLAYFSASYTLECITENVTDVRAVTIPKYTVFFIIPIGLLFLTVQFIRMTVARYQTIKAGG